MLRDSILRIERWIYQRWGVGLGAGYTAVFLIKLADCVESIELWY